MSPLLQKPRSAFFKLGSFFYDISKTMMQPNGEALRLYSQSQIEFAKIASTELIQAIIDFIVCYFADYASKETISKIQELKEMESKDVLTLQDLSYRQITKIIRKEIVANRNETTAMRSEVAVLRTEIAAIHKVLEETKYLWSSIAESLKGMHDEIKKSNVVLKEDYENYQNVMRSFEKEKFTDEEIENYQNIDEEIEKLVDENS